jgi:acyl dehydratase
MNFGGHYEDFQIGAVYRHWPGRTVAEYDNTLFALLSMNQNPLFIDEEYAKSQPLGRRPVIDTLVFSLTVGMSVADMTGKAVANLGYDVVTFERPLFPGVRCMRSRRFSKSASRAASPIGALWRLKPVRTTKTKNASSSCGADF